MEALLEGGISMVIWLLEERVGWGTKLADVLSWQQMGVKNARATAESKGKAVVTVATLIGIGMMMCWAYL